MTLHQPVQSILEQSIDSFGRIAAKAHSIVGNHRVESPQDMRAFAANLGYHVRFSRLLPATLPGYSVVLDGVPYIHVKRDITASSTIYTLAHEIGHHQLAHLADRLLSDEQREIEANVFALTLLPRLAPRSLDDILRDNPDGRVTSWFLVVGSVALAFSVFASWVIKRLSNSNGVQTHS